MPRLGDEKKIESFLGKHRAENSCVFLMVITFDCDDNVVRRLLIISVDIDLYSVSVLVLYDFIINRLHRLAIYQPNRSVT